MFKFIPLQLRHELILSTSQRSFIQMINRVRKITDNEIVLRNIDGHHNTLFNLNEIKEFL